MKNLKKLSAVLLIAAIFIAMFSFAASAAGMSVKISGASSVYSGNRLKVTVSVSSTNGIYNVLGNVSFEDARLEYVGASGAPSGWSLTANRSGSNIKIMAEDNSQSKAIKSQKQVCVLEFKVKSLSAGTQMLFKASGFTGADVNFNDVTASASTYTVTVAEPPSSDATLRSLTVSNATISPAFNKNVVSYSASVPFETSKLNVTAVQTDVNAKVSVNSPNLTAGGRTNVTVTVTAPSGAKKTYTIAVTRAQDPNYQASGNSELSGLSATGLVLSPEFKKDKKTYEMLVPYSKSSVEIKGSPADSRASVKVTGADSLEAGKANTITVVCRAESGAETSYTIIAYRADANGEFPVSLVAKTGSENPTEEQTTAEPGSDNETTKPASQSENGENENKKDSGKVSGTTLIIAAATSLVVGIALGMLILMLTKKKKDGNR